jgi:hypothetical protein
MTLRTPLRRSPQPGLLARRPGSCRRGNGNLLRFVTVQIGELECFRSGSSELMWANANLLFRNVRATAGTGIFKQK